MDLLTLLKQLHTITPDPTYTSISRRAVLSVRPRRNTGVRHALKEAFHTSLVFVFASILLLFLFGGLSLFGFGERRARPLAALDPLTLRAEADAIDIQIQLTKLTYVEPTSTPTANLTTRATSPDVALTVPPNLQEEVAEVAESLGLPLPATSTVEYPTVPGIDEALEELSR